MYRAPAHRTSDARQRCLYCGGENTPGAECFKCRVLVPPSDGANLRPSACARCPNPWLDATELGPSDATAFACRSCHSAFINAGAWTALLDGVLAGEPIRLAQLAGQRLEPPASLNLFPLVRCSVCRYEMERARFGANTKLVIDVCNAHGVWLDPAELPALVEVLRAGGEAPERAGGGRGPEAPIDPMEMLLMNELREAESAYDRNAHGRWMSKSDVRKADTFLHAMNTARMALDNYRLRKLATRQG